MLRLNDLGGARAGAPNRGEQETNMNWCGARHRDLGFCVGNLLRIDDGRVTAHVQSPRRQQGEPAAAMLECQVQWPRNRWQ